MSQRNVILGRVGHFVVILLEKTRLKINKLNCFVANKMILSSDSPFTHSMAPSSSSSSAPTHTNSIAKTEKSTRALYTASNSRMERINVFSVVQPRCALMEKFSTKAGGSGGDTDRAPGLGFSAQDFAIRFLLSYTKCTR